MIATFATKRSRVSRASTQPSNRAIFNARDYGLAITLASGQAFRWEEKDGSWVGVVNGRWIKLEQRGDEIVAEATELQAEWGWMADYLQVQTDMRSILATFPDDKPMREATKACRGLRLLRQEPWECLASFILSSTKQIVQIRQIIAIMTSRHGAPLAVPHGEKPMFAFPTAESIAALSEAKLRACKMGFRAHMLAAARSVANGECDLEKIKHMSVSEAREELMKLPGVGEKIANCVLLFAYGFPTAFPVDVWVMKVMKQFYFRRRRMRLSGLREFSEKYFGPHAGYAQQYLFHWVRTQGQKELSA